MLIPSVSPPFCNGKIKKSKKRAYKEIIKMKYDISIVTPKVKRVDYYNFVKY
jgi:hypothetical protein